MNPIRLFTAAMAISSAAAIHGQLVINELMQSNIDCIMDDMNEFPDSWVELYNAGSVTVNLSSYSIGDKAEPEKAWRLPARTVAPGACAIVYCDKAADGMHTSFRLESGKGGAVYLFKGAEIVDKVENWKKQPAPNIAYGRTTDGDAAWGYQATPTPGAANCGTTCNDILGEPAFSTAGRVASTPFDLSLTLPADAPEGTVIRYTTDGTEPVATSRLYTSPIHIASTTTVRAKLFCDGMLSPRSTTCSYIFFPREMTIPVVSIVTDRKYFYDSKIGIYVEGNDPNDKNYSHDWRRPANIELFVAGGEPAVINQLCETRVKGGASRDNKLKSLVMYANKRFGTKRFEYEFFPEDAPGLTDWKSFELRNAGNDFDYLYFRDAAIQRIMGRNVDLDWQPWRPAVVYVNGSYLGMLNIRSRTNEDYIYTFYDGLEDIDLIENGKELKEGTWDNYRAFEEFYASHDNSLDDFRKWMDVEEYANYMAMQLFYDNKDFPGNNVVCWRPTADGSLWRWIAKDTDFGLGLYGARYDYPTFDWLYNPDYDPAYAWANGYEATRLFRRLMDIGEFKTLFSDRCAIYMGDFMNYRGTTKVLDEMYALIKDEYPHHRKLINQWWPNYQEELAAAKEWVRKRTDFFYTHLAGYYSLGQPRAVTIDAGRSDDIALTVNGIALNNRSFDGKYFEGKTITVSSEPEVAGWSVEIKNGTSVTTASYPGAGLSFTIPACTSLAISSITDPASIESVSATESFDPARPVEIFDLSGRSRGNAPSLGACDATLAPGVYILRQEAATVKHIVR